MLDFENCWAEIAEIMQDGLLLVDPSGVILSVNPATERLTGYSRKELIGSKCTILSCTGCKIFGGECGEDWCDLYRKGKVNAKRCQVTGKDRQVREVLKYASVLHDKDGNLIGAIETLRDITNTILKDEEILRLKANLSEVQGFFGILGHSQAMTHLFELIGNIAQSHAPVMILGESGVGKELIARAVHEASPRANGPFIKVNCAALNENLLESELFGHVKGAYTGAEQARMGRFEAASGGSIFLDEIGDVPLSSQVKLLRVLEEKEIERVGSQQLIPVDVRIITATNRDPEQLLSDGRFREDFYYRINVIPLQVPPLRERVGDIPLLANSFLERLLTNSTKPITGFSAETLHCLESYNWPGNCRELRNAIEYAFVLCTKDSIELKHLPPKITEPKKPEPSTSPVLPKPKLEPSPEREQIIETLRSTQCNRTQAAKILGYSRITLWKKIKKYNINVHNL